MSAAPQDLENDPLGINKPVAKLTHQLCLASAYGSYADAADSGPEVAKQKARLDSDFFEPKFSNVARDFKGTLDYILYTTDTLVR
jgi:CCR4-NOT transcription complex subunit 6